MPSMLNRVDKQYGYLSDSIDILEDNPVIILRTGDLLPSVSDLNSEQNTYISLEDSTSKEYFLVTSAPGRIGHVLVLPTAPKSLERTLGQTLWNRKHWVSG